MNRVTKFATIFLLASTLPTILPALAQEDSTDKILDSQPGRYTFNKTAKGYVRLDSETGEISLCTLNSDNLVCQLGADERMAYEFALNEMRDEIDTLQERLNQLKTDTNSAGAEKPEKSKSPDEMEFPPEFDTAMDFAQEAMRRFYSVIQDLKKDYEDKLGPSSKPKS